MIICSRCRSKNPDGTTNCQGCGKVLRPRPRPIPSPRIPEYDERYPEYESPGYPRANTLQSELKNPGIAAVLSFLIVGLGQVYNGEIGKGIVLILIYFIALGTILIGIGIFLVPVLWLYGVLDAYNTAKRLNETGY